MITVTLRYPDGRFDEIEADDAEAAVLGARTIWNEACDYVAQGFRKALVMTFFVDGKCVRMFKGVCP